MAQITNTDDTIDIRDVIARVEELREQHTPRYVAGWNMPGFMPDAEPAEFGDAEGAKRYVIDQIKADEEDQEEEEKAEALAALAEEVNLESDEFSVTASGRAYWVTLDGTMGLDDEETAELAELEALLEECKGNGGDEQWEGDWYPVTLIRDSYFRDYAEELAEDMGMAASNDWPYRCIDWDQAARELQTDYTSVEFDGTTYWVR